MTVEQKTICKETRLEGRGLHTGDFVRVCLKPAPPGSGLKFVRTDLNGTPAVAVNPNEIVIDNDIPRCTTLGRADVTIHTVEHLLSAASGTGITNLEIEMDGKEVPGMDGSSLPFVEAIKQAGIERQDADVRPLRVIKPVGVSRNEASIYIIPSTDFRISYTLDYPDTFVGSQFLSVIVTEDSFQKEIAPARTFCLEEEANQLKTRGLGKGANTSNTLVIGKERVLENTVRFPDEFARHKILDLIGDLYVLGVPVFGHIFAVKSGHRLNMDLVRKLQSQLETAASHPPSPGFDSEGKRIYHYEDLKKILPHRYPFLFVDRVVEIERGKKVVGIKNVSINEHFFQGHFPTRPVMPGVIMVEAMAQTSGILFQTDEYSENKLAFFMAVDEVKFRKVVEPGDQLLMEIDLIRCRGKIAKTHGVARVGEDVVAEAVMTFVFADGSYLDPDS